MRYLHVDVLRRGGPETLQPRNGTLSDPGPGLVRVAVEHAGVSYGDVLLRSGVIPNSPKPPFTPGFDVTGTIEAVGPDVAGRRVGQRVVALQRHGGYTTAALVRADRLVTVPDGVSSELVAATALNYFVAHQMLHRVAALGGRDTAVVHGASGGVGTALLQLGALAGVRIIGTSSAANRGIVTRLGAMHIDYRNEDIERRVAEFADGGVDAVFDSIGGSHFRRSYRMLRRGGSMVGYGQSAALRNGRARLDVGARGFITGIALPKLWPDGRTTVFYNAWSLEREHPTAYREDLELVVQLLADGKIEPALIRTVALDRAADAHRLLESQSATGKVVLRCAGRA